MLIPQKLSLHSTLSPPPISVTRCWCHDSCLPRLLLLSNHPFNASKHSINTSWSPFTTSTEIASLPDMFDQRCSPASCNKQRSWSQIIVITNKHDWQLASPTIPQDHCFFDTAKQEWTSNASITQYGFEDCPTQPLASRLTNRSHAVRLQRHPPAFDACRCSNTTIQAHLRSTLQITRVNSNSHLHARRHFTQRLSRNHDTPRLLRGIHSSDIYLETSGTHQHETALINHSPSHTTTPFRSNWTPLPHRIPSHHLPSQRLSSSI